MLLLLRTMANAFQEEGRTDAEWLGRVSRFLIMNRYILTAFVGQKVVETIGQAPYAVLNRAQRVALATVLFKYLYPAFTVRSLLLNSFFLPQSQCLL